MRRILATAVALAALAVTPTSASAVGDLVGTTCGFEAVRVTPGMYQFAGVLYGAVATGNPGVTVTLRCWITVNSSAYLLTTESGVNAAAVLLERTFDARDTDVVEVCTVATLSTGRTTGKLCYHTGIVTVPPSVVCDTVSAACLPASVETMTHTPQSIVLL